jgi:hypothetical protein
VLTGQYDPSHNEAMPRKQPFAPGYGRTASADDVERLLMVHSLRLQAILEAARKRFRAGGGIPHEIFWKRVEAESARRTNKPNQARKAGPANGRS